MKLQTTNQQFRKGGYITALLLRVGVPQRMLKRKGGGHSFWERCIDFMAILETARDKFRQRIKTVAGNKAQQLIAAYRTIQRRFAQRGWVLE